MFENIPVFSIFKARFTNILALESIFSTQMTRIRYHSHIEISRNEGMSPKIFALYQPITKVKRG
jgi:hypothetical protein